jgi:hypothetical protein
LRIVSVEGAQICCSRGRGKRKLMQNEGVQPSPASPSVRPANRDARQRNVAPAGVVDKVQGPVNVVPRVEAQPTPSSHPVGGRALLIDLATASTAYPISLNA